MKRITKPPEVRRQELLNTAMELFTQKGYEETSMGEIAQAAGVAQGLCYRYFDSKQKLFQEAMEQYVQVCCADFLPLIHDRSRSIPDRVEEMARRILAQDQNSPYSAFYHREDHRDLHQELSLHICRCLLPHVVQELRASCETGELSLRRPEIAASFLLHGQIGLLGPGDCPLEERVEEILRYAHLILTAG